MSIEVDYTDMNKSIMFALAIVVTCSAWLFAGKLQPARGVYLVTTFDFARYPACRPGTSSNCVQAIRFYDADSDQELAEANTNARMRGTQRIMARVNDGPLPRRAYAIAVYLDGSGSRKEGPRGQTTQLQEADHRK